MVGGRRTESFGKWNLFHNTTDWETAFVLPHCLTDDHGLSVVIAIIYLSSSSVDGGDITATQKVMSFSSSVILVLYGPNNPAATLLSWPCRSFERVFPVIVVSTVISITFVSLPEWMVLLPYRLGFIYKINEASSHSTIESTQSPHRRNRAPIRRQSIQEYQWQRTIYRHHGMNGQWN